MASRKGMKKVERPIIIDNKQIPIIERPLPLDSVEKLGNNITIRINTPRYWYMSLLGKDIQAIDIINREYVKVAVKPNNIPEFLKQDHIILLVMKSDFEIVNTL